MVDHHVEEAVVRVESADGQQAVVRGYFATEPLPADSPLLNRQNVITTPHLGASTTEAQQGVALTVAEQMRDYLLNGELRGAVNVHETNMGHMAQMLPFAGL